MLLIRTFGAFAAHAIVSGQVVENAVVGRVADVGVADRGIAVAECGSHPPLLRAVATGRASRAAW